MTCQSKTRNTSIECSDAPEMFETIKIWGGRKEKVIECLSHAVASEQRGQCSTVIQK
jgi:hypothetical protein